MGVYDKKIQISISKTKEVVVLTDEPGYKEEEKINIDENTISELEVDLNYLIGLIIGEKISKDTYVKINGRINCSCKEIMYNKYFDSLSNLTHSILNKNEYRVKGTSFKYSTKMGENDYILDTRIGKDEDEETYRIIYESKIKPPIKLLKIINGLFSEMNGVNKIIGEI